MVLGDWKFNGMEDRTFWLTNIVFRVFLGALLKTEDGCREIRGGSNSVVRDIRWFKD